jgi:hypothetical protein
MKDFHAGSPLDLHATSGAIGRHNIKGRVPDFLEKLIADGERPPEGGMFEAVTPCHAAAVSVQSLDICAGNEGHQFSRRGFIYLQMDVARDVVSYSLGQGFETETAPTKLVRLEQELEYIMDPACDNVRFRSKKTAVMALQSRPAART